MKESGRTKRSVSTLAMVGSCIVGLAITVRAEVGCSDFSRIKPAIYLNDGLQKESSSMRFVRTAAEADDEDYFSPKRDELMPIVGLWKFQFTAKGNKGIPDGLLIDFGPQTWHADYTEILSSGGRPPPSGSVCMGAWERVGPHHYRLHHIGESWNDAGTVFIGPGDIREDVYVDHERNSFHGTFSITQFSTDEKTVLAAVKGTVTATRVTPSL